MSRPARTWPRSDLYAHTAPEAFGVVVDPDIVAVIESFNAPEMVAERTAYRALANSHFDAWRDRRALRCEVNEALEILSLEML